MRRPTLALHVAFTAAVLASPAAGAATLSVCSTCTYTTIQDAVDAASDGDTVSVAAGTWDEDVSIDGTDITLAGAGATTIIDNSTSAQGTNAVYVTDATVTIQDLTINPYERAISVERSSKTTTLHVADVTFGTADVGSGSGAHIVSDSAPVDVGPCVFSSGSAAEGGSMRGR